MAQNRNISFSISAVDRASATIKRITNRLEKIASPVAKANRAFQKAEKSTKKYTESLDRLAGKFKSVGTTATIGLTLPIAAVGATSIKTAADFEHSMTKVKTLTGGEMFRELKDQAREFGATTMHSASQAADAMVFFSMAGFKANETYKVMGSTLNLATAATTELSRTADIMANVVRGYNIPVDEIGKATDMLTGAFSSAKMDLATLGDSLVKTTLLNSVNIPLSETLALIGQLRTAGVDPSSTGTALAMGVSRLIKPVKAVSERIKSLLKVDADTLVDSKGGLGSFISILERLENAGATPADFMAIFGQEAGKYIIKLRGASGAVKQLKHQIENSTGITKDFAKAFQSGATGAMYAFKSSIEAVQISIGESGLLDDFTKVTNSVTKYIQALSKANPAMIRLATIIAIIVGLIGPLLIALSAVITNLAAMIVFLKFASAIAVVFGTTLLAFFGILILKITLVIAAIGVAVYYVWFMFQNWKKVLTTIRSLLEAYFNYAMIGFRALFFLIKNLLIAFFQALNWLGEFLVSFWESPKKAMHDAAEDMKETILNFVDSIITSFYKLSSEVMPTIKKIMNFLIDPSGRYVEFVVEADYSDYPSLENEVAQRLLNFGEGPLLEVPKTDFNYNPLGFIKDVETPSDDLNLMPDFLEGLGSTIHHAFTSPIINIDDKIKLDIDEEKLGKNMDLKPKVNFPKRLLPKAQFDAIKPFRQGEFIKQRFKDGFNRQDFIKGSSEKIEKILENKTILVTSKESIGRHTESAKEATNNIFQLNEIKEIQKYTALKEVYNETSPSEVLRKVNPAIEVTKERDGPRFDRSKIESVFAKDETVKAPRSNEVRIFVEFENLPKGTKIRKSNPDDIPLSVNMGFAMDGMG